MMVPEVEVDMVVVMVVVVVTEVVVVGVPEGVEVDMEEDEMARKTDVVIAEMHLIRILEGLDLTNRAKNPVAPSGNVDNWLHCGLFDVEGSINSRCV